MSIKKKVVLEIGMSSWPNEVDLSSHMEMFVDNLVSYAKNEARASNWTLLFPSHDEAYNVSISVDHNKENKEKQ